MSTAKILDNITRHLETLHEEIRQLKGPDGIEGVLKHLNNFDNKLSTLSFNSSGGSTEPTSKKSKKEPRDPNKPKKPLNPQLEFGNKIKVDLRKLPEFNDDKYPKTDNAAENKEMVAQKNRDLEKKVKELWNDAEKNTKAKYYKERQKLEKAFPIREAEFKEAMKKYQQENNMPVASTSKTTKPVTKSKSKGKSPNKKEELQKNDDVDEELNNTDDEADDILDLDD